MSRYHWLPEQQALWRKSDFVVTIEDTGDRGRMRGSGYHAPLTLHRPSCPTLKEREKTASNPCDVYSQSIKEWEASKKKVYSAHEHKVCLRCCRDLSPAKGPMSIERDTPIIPEAVARRILTDVDAAAGTFFSDEAIRDNEYVLCRMAQNAYLKSKAFRKSIRAGDSAGRDFLYRRMRQWLAGYIAFRCSNVESDLGRSAFALLSNGEDVEPKP
jgi:hypothetical protein